MKMSYNEHSPYYNTPQTSWYLSNWSGIDIGEDSTDSFLKIPSKYKYRPDLLAYDLYDDVNLWWVFMLRNPNDIVDPIYDFVEGLEIYTPTLERINSIIGD